MTKPTVTARPVLRPAAPTEVPALAALFTASVHALAAAYYTPEQLAAWAPQPPDLAGWRQRLSALRTLVAEADGQLAGFIAYAVDGHIDLLFVAPEHARSGVASRLYTAAEQALRGLGVKTLRTEASEAARGFFARHGFEVLELQEAVRGGQRLRRYAMRKHIA